MHALLLFSPTMSGSTISAPSKSPFGSLVVTFPPDPSHRARLAPYFETIAVVPRGETPSDVLLKDAEVIYGLPLGQWFTGLEQVPKLRFIQLSNAGSDVILDSPLWKDAESKRIQIATASGVHTGPIPQAATLSCDLV